MKTQLGKCEKILFLTGAGISADSGIGTYRGVNEKWLLHNPDDSHIANLKFGNLEKKRKFWELACSLYEACLNKEPNPNHELVAKLVKAGKAIGVVTQNVDGLHNTTSYGDLGDKLVEFHGNFFRSSKTKGGPHDEPDFHWYDQVKSGNYNPTDSRGKSIRPDIVFFGDDIKGKDLRQTRYFVNNCDACVVLGSTLMVYPFAGYVEGLLRRKIPLYIFNMGETPFDGLATYKDDRPLAESFLPLFSGL